MYYIIDNSNNFILENGRLYEDEELIRILENHNNQIDDLEIYLNKYNIKFLYFTSKTKYKNELYKALNKLAEVDYEVDFDKLANKIPEYKLHFIKNIQRGRHYGEAYLNRIIDVKNDKVYSGCLLHYLGFMVGARYVCQYNEYVDEIPFLIYNKIILYLKFLNKQEYLNKFILGYRYDTNKIDSNYNIRDLKATKIISTPENPGVEFETMNLFNSYIKDGINLLPMTELDID